MWDKEPYSNRGETDAKGPDAEGGKFQKSQERDREEARAEVGRSGPRRSDQPILGPIRHPFDLADPRAIYSPLPRATDQFIHHPPPRSREARGTPS
jgi:hypothetical protein